MNSTHVYTDSTLETAGFSRRLAALLYDSLLLIAVILVAVTAFTLPIDLIWGQDTANHLLKIPLAKFLFWLYLLFIIILFFAWFWSHGGQTLGMKVWRLRVVGENDQPLQTTQALRRASFALIGMLPLGLGFFWILFNPEKRALYELWSKTRTVVLEK